MSDLFLYSDQDLLLKVTVGNEHAFRQLFSKYHQQLGVYVYRITDSVDLAEDIVQDVFLKIWMSREALAGVDNFKAYLFVMSKNHTLNCLRKIAREQLKKKGWENNFNNVLKSREEETNIYYNLLDEAIDKLPPQQQKVYLLSRHERLKYAEIGQRLNISGETVKKYLQIATTSITAYVHTNLEKLVFLLIMLKNI
ncbi:RNA polymerase sigma factor [Arcticibacter eurypsychrophilus]|uniref:RNA polymerase sigma factor n=1 Tax=Arcticibacter eurypsychrophilus TaxID=1434752 RepID=UPI00084CF1DA|nr:RNA polymerase sigma-70 factor [Arcticibacter eurypsychrophilus]